MARYTGPRLKIIRRLGTSLPGLMRTDPDLRRPYPPGQHGPTRRKKLSDYAMRLMEKQKIRFHYGVSEKQLRGYVKEAFSRKGNSGSNLLVSLESRLDNVVFRAGYAPTIVAARQMTRHGHFVVNEKRVNIPSFRVRPGDKLSLRSKSKMRERGLEALKDPNNLSRPSFIEVDDDTGVTTVKAMPEATDCVVEVDSQLIVEYYSGK
jgi:small subunit ribosomal protein S4